MKKNHLIGTLLFLILFSPLFSQAKTVYISPNNDGIQDELSIPLSIKDKRYISEWNLIVLDSENTIVRTIGNKHAKETNATSVFQSLFAEKGFKPFWTNLKKLFAPKKGIEVPEVVVWNGFLDSGEVAPDGNYSYYFIAKDDNGNEAKTSMYSVVVDNTPPAIALLQPKDEAKIFGSNLRNAIKIEQDGSSEDLWEAEIKDALGNSVKSYTWKNDSPKTIEWDARNNAGDLVADGVYSYAITATDRAGNKSEKAEVLNIIYDALPRSVNLTVLGSPFSPNADGIQDSLRLEPSIPNASGLLSWTIDIISPNQESRIYKRFEGKTTPQAFSFDGKSEAGSVLGDGEYQALFQANFNNGQIAKMSRNFIIDTRAPQASLVLETPIFSPDGDGNLDLAIIAQSVSKEKNWQAEILDANRKKVRSYSFGDNPPEKVQWDGLHDNGSLAEDGLYSYKLIATDDAGNTGFAETKLFELNTGTTEVILTVQNPAFSPNKDGVNDVLVLTPVVKTKSEIVEYRLDIFNERGESVKSFADKKALPRNFQWDGLHNNGSLCPDALYTAQLETVSKNGSEAKTLSQPITLDTQYPALQLSADYLVFSPNGDGKKDLLPIKIAGSEENQWIAEIKNQAKTTVKKITWQGSPASFDWDGKDENNNTVADGNYSLLVSSTDDAGNKTEKQIPLIVVDNRPTKAFVTAELSAFSPNADGIKDEQVFTIMTSLQEGIASWSLAILSENGASVQKWTGNDAKSLPAKISWDGKDSSGKVVEGSLTADLEIIYEKGDEVFAKTSSFLSSITPPQLLVKTSPQYFSPDNDGQDDELFINLSAKSAVPFTSWSFEINDPQNGKTFWKTSGKSAITERITWDGKSNTGELVQSATDYPYTFTVSDDVGMTSRFEGLISVDVLVIRVGDVLKIQIPSIIFRPDNADFKSKKEVANGLEQSVIDNNVRVLKRIAEILNKFRDYTVRVEGHANNVTNTEKEEIEELVPLSQARAAFVKEELRKYGVSSARLSTVGLGGRQPVVPHTDRDNWWKNRRVEFILNK